MTTESNGNVIIVSGLSGSGKSVALRTLEDLGYHCIDNLPAHLLPALVADIDQNDARRTKIAVSIDVRNMTNDLSLIGQLLSQVNHAGYSTRLAFFDTEDAVLIKRFSDTRRRHPLSMGGLALSDAIAQERKQLRPLVTLADWVIDTSQLSCSGSTPAWVASSPPLPLLPRLAAEAGAGEGEASAPSPSPRGPTPPV